MDIDKMSTTELLNLYWKLEEEVDVLKEKISRYNKARELIRVAVGKRELVNGTEMVRHSLGTIYTRKGDSIVVSHSSKFLQWLQKTQRWDFLKLAPAKRNIMKYANEAKDFPDGLRYDQWSKILINKPTVKGE